MDPSVFFKWCKATYLVVAFIFTPMLVMFLVFKLSFRKGEKHGAFFLYLIGMVATISAFLFTMCLMIVLTKYIAACFPSILENPDERRGFAQAQPQDNLRQGIEMPDRTRGLVAESEEAREQKLQELFKSFPSVSYASQGIGLEARECAICLGEFVEGDLCWVLPSCKHMFHSFCIERWLTICLCCPVCRNSVSQV